ncbi:unnamed protein product [Tenebrio molitor]|nr:unnamed protein product [Tenebrio molitor]
MAGSRLSKLFLGTSSLICSKLSPVDASSNRSCLLKNCIP